ncbi:hypothetical protein AAVH_40444, partial [Aphelenchoides avenae]
KNIKNNQQEYVGLLHSQELDVAEDLPGYAIVELLKARELFLKELLNRLFEGQV